MAKKMGGGIDGLRTSAKGMPAMTAGKGAIYRKQSAQSGPTAVTPARRAASSTPKSPGGPRMGAKSTARGVGLPPKRPRGY